MNTTKFYNRIDALLELDAVCISRNTPRGKKIRCHIGDKRIKSWEIWHASEKEFKKILQEFQDEGNRLLTAES